MNIVKVIISILLLIFNKIFISFRKIANKFFLLGNFISKSDKQEQMAPKRNLLIPNLIQVNGRMYTFFKMK
ncbi:hypothetical protein AMS60_01100 [Bacillus sp. FJAT-21945]|nr:hypothetical protein AMS60_01100 [Bacillus sp. FJAT-21945]